MLVCLLTGIVHPSILIAISVEMIPFAAIPLVCALDGPPTVRYVPICASCVALIKSKFPVTWPGLLIASQVHPLKTKSSKTKNTVIANILFISSPHLQLCKIEKIRICPLFFFKN